MKLRKNVSKSARSNHIRVQLYKKKIAKNLKETDKIVKTFASDLQLVITLQFQNDKLQEIKKNSLFE